MVVYHEEIIMKKRVMCYGDSNTWGYDAVTDGRFDEDTRWTALLQKNLGEDYTVIEEGLCGRTSVFEDPLNEGLNGLTHLYPCMMSQSPLDYLVVMLGTNDCKQRYSATPQNIAGGIRRLLTKAKQIPAWRDEPKILLVCPAPIEPECEHALFAGEMGICSERSRGLADEFCKCAKELDVKFWDSAEVVTMNKIDFMHLDAESHKRFADKVAGILENWGK